jgi:hypothetical protein
VCWDAAWQRRGDRRPGTARGAPLRRPRRAAPPSARAECRALNAAPMRTVLAAPRSRSHARGSSARRRPAGRAKAPRARARPAGGSHGVAPPRRAARPDIGNVVQRWVGGSVSGRGTQAWAAAAWRRRRRAPLRPPPHPPPPHTHTNPSPAVRFDNKNEDHPDDLWPQRRHHVAAIIEKCVCGGGGGAGRGSHPWAEAGRSSRLEGAGCCRRRPAPAPRWPICARAPPGQVPADARGAAGGGGGGGAGGRPPGWLKAGPVLAQLAVSHSAWTPPGTQPSPPLPPPLPRSPTSTRWSSWTRCCLITAGSAREAGQGLGVGARERAPQLTPSCPARPAPRPPNPGPVLTTSPPHPTPPNPTPPHPTPPHPTPPHPTSLAPAAAATCRFLASTRPTMSTTRSFMTRCPGGGGACATPGPLACRPRAAVARRLLAFSVAWPASLPF